MVYTDVFKGFQIRDITYLVEPKTKPIKYDVVKWVEHDPPLKTTNLETGKKETTERTCYSVATIEFNQKEPCFEFNSVGLRWLSEHPDTDVEEWIIKWCEYKLHELVNNI